jgi:hypothetical protein
MITNGSTELSNSHAGIRRSGLLQVVALVATGAGAVGSVAVQLYAGRRSPQHLVLLLIAGWVLSPFAILVFLHFLSKRWPALTQRALHCVMLFVSVASLGIYSIAIVRPLASKPPAFLFVAVPPCSLLLAAITLAIASLISRRLGHQRVAA